MNSIKSAGLFSKVPIYHATQASQHLAISILCYLCKILFFPQIQAILESEPFSITLKTVGKAKLLGEQFAKELGCSDIDCLHNKVYHS